MKLEINVIKSLLAHIENSADYPDTFIINKVDGIEADSATINYHLVLMIEAGLISGREKINRDRRYVLVERLTWAGHDFLANAKNPVYGNDLGKQAVLSARFQSISYKQH